MNIVMGSPDQVAKVPFRVRIDGEVPPDVGPGNGIGIHGTGDRSMSGSHKQTDWTHGCIALDDEEIDELGQIVRDGTKVVIVD